MYSDGTCLCVWFGLVVYLYNMCADRIVCAIGSKLETRVVI